MGTCGRVYSCCRKRADGSQDIVILSSSPDQQFTLFFSLLIIHPIHYNITIKYHQHQVIFCSAHRCTQLDRQSREPEKFHFLFLFEWKLMVFELFFKPDTWSMQDRGSSQRLPIHLRWSLPKSSLDSTESVECGPSWSQTCRPWCRWWSPSWWAWWTRWAPRTCSEWWGSSGWRRKVEQHESKQRARTENEKFKGNEWDKIRFEGMIALKKCIFGWFAVPVVRLLWAVYSKEVNSRVKNTWRR